LQVLTIGQQAHLDVTSTKVNQVWRSWVRAPSKAPVVSLSKKLYPYCLVLVGYRNGFERDITIELN